MKTLCGYLGGVFVFLTCLFFFVPCAQAGEITLAWDANAEPDIDGYKVYVGVESRRYVDAFDVGNFTSCVVSGLEQGQTYYFAATAYNQMNLESDFSNEVMTTLSPVNQAPLADAGPDQNVSEGVLVTLDGSNSTDPDGDGLNFFWSQVQGSPVILDEPSAARTTFHVPYVGTEGETLIFQLTVTDSGGLQSSDQSAVLIKGSNTGVDLTGEWLWISRSFAGRSGNCFMEGTLRAENLGTRWADSSLLYVYESDDSEWDSRDAYLGSATIPALEAGQSVDISYKFKSNSKTSPIYLIAVMDATYLLDDINEENNIVSSWPVK